MRLVIVIPVVLFLISAKSLTAQRGYFDAPYIRYEANLATLKNGALVTPKSYSQIDLQSEASEQVCVDMSSENATAEFTFSEEADGLVIRYSVPDEETATIALYNENEKITRLTLTSKWSWEYLWKNGDPNNVGIKNKNPRMRFDEIRFKLPSKVSNLQIVKETGNLSLDFIEMEIVPEEIQAPEGSVVYNGDGSTLQDFIDANGSKTIYLPAGIYNVNSQLYFGVANTKLQGAGMWYSQINFTVTDESNGGLRANAPDICYSDLFLTTDMTTRTNGYGGIIGVYTKGSVIKNIWVEHCATGAWIGQYTPVGPEYADGFLITGCRFRNTYADGINLCKGTRNAVVEHCNFRNNGDDGMAIWSAEGLECINNTYRFNTVENGWRAAGAALYGGKDNKFYNILIKDNVDVGITITNTFPGVGFNENGMHDFHDITMTGCGTFNSIYNDRVGAVNIYHARSAGTKIQNVRLYNVDIYDSKCDGIRIAKSSGDGIFNLVFENVNINKTGLEYPENNVENSMEKRGFGVIFEKYPLGGATYCNLNLENLGGNAEGEEFSVAEKGSFRWLKEENCEIIPVEGITLSPADTSIAGGANISLVPKFLPANASNQIVSYKSSNPEVASVNYDGVVTGLSKGQTTIYVVTQEGEFSANSNINVTSNPEIYYKIKNRWQNTYLFDSGDKVEYSLKTTDDKFMWKLEEINGKKRIRNISSGDVMHIENQLGFVQCTADFTDSLSSEWLITDAGDGFVRIESAKNTNDFMHIENLQNQLQYGNIDNSWWSAMWILEPVLITGANQYKLIKNVHLYPNPSDGNFYLNLESFQTNEKIDIVIYSSNGQLLLQENFIVQNYRKKGYQINLKNSLSPGFYYILISGKSGKAGEKFIIQ